LKLSGTLNLYLRILENSDRFDSLIVILIDSKEDNFKG